MFYQQPLPFYMTYPVPYMFDNEQDQEREAQIMKSYYPQMAGKIQEYVERECDKMEYDGSMMYEEYPDKFMMQHLCEKIEIDVQRDLQYDLKNQQMESQDFHHRGFDDVISVLLFNEIFRRRCRHRRCGRYF